MGAQVCPSLGRDSGAEADVGLKCHGSRAVLLQVRECGDGEWSLGPRRAAHGEGKLSLGSSPRVLTDRPRSETAPLPAQASAARGRRGPDAAHLLPLLPLALGLFQGCLELHDVSPEEFPGHYWPSPPPARLAAAATTYGHRELERKRGLGGPAGQDRASLPGHAPRGENEANRNSPRGNSPREAQPPSANENLTCPDGPAHALK